MRPALTGLFALGVLLVSSGAEAAMQFRCSWEGRMPVAITVEGDANALRYSPYDVGGSYYDIVATRSGVWLLLDEPKPVLSIQMIWPDPPLPWCWTRPLTVVAVGSDLVCRNEEVVPTEDIQAELPQRTSRTPSAVQSVGAAPSALLTASINKTAGNGLCR